MIVPGARLKLLSSVHVVMTSARAVSSRYCCLGEFLAALLIWRIRLGINLCDVTMYDKVNDDEVLLLGHALRRIAELVQQAGLNNLGSIIIANLMS